MTAGGGYRVRAFRSPGDIGDLWPTLSGLTDRDHAHPFQARDVLDVWMKTIGLARKTQAVFVRVDDASGNPVMLVPLGIERHQGLRTLEFLDGGVADYNAPILFDAARAIEAPEMADIWASIVAALPPFDFAGFEKLPLAVNGIANPFCLLASTVEDRSAHVLELRGTWDEFSAQGPRHQRDMRRKRRRLADIGPVRFVVADGLEETNRLLATMIRQKSRRYIETRGRDSFDRPGYRSFYPAMTEEFAARGLVHLSALLVGDEAIATHWGIAAGGRFYHLMPSYETGKWTRFSPGRILIEELIAWCYGQNLTAFDFGPGDEPYKADYSNETVALSGGRIAASSRARMIGWLVRGPAGPALKAGRDWIARRFDRAAQR